MTPERMIKAYDGANLMMCEDAWTADRRNRPALAMVFLAEARRVTAMSKALRALSNADKGLCDESHTTALDRSGTIL